jgi:hypothetical protein
LCKAALESAQVASRVHHEDLKKPTKFVSLWYYDQKEAQ